jgi:hypothetical protein
MADAIARLSTRQPLKLQHVHAHTTFYTSTCFTCVVALLHINLIQRSLTYGKSTTEFPILGAPSISGHGCLFIGLTGRGVAARDVVGPAE